MIISLIIGLKIFSPFYVLPITVLIYIGNMISVCMHCYAINITRKYFILPVTFFSTAILIWIFCKLYGFEWLGILMITTSGFASNLVCAWAGFVNPQWKGLQYRNLLIAGFIASSGIFVWRSMLILSGQNNEALSPEFVASQIGVLITLIASTVLQIGFVGLVVSYDLRLDRRKKREAVTAADLSYRLVEEQRLNETESKERLDLLSLLTHEVRQPINTAQAALQALAQETNTSEPADAEVRDAIASAQNVLDEITLSISNAILAVSMIGNNQTITTATSDLVELVELAVRDCPIEQSHRIHSRDEGSAVFSNFNPVLMRLALRNLFDNALKYSPQNSSVQVEIAHDDQRFGAFVKVSNQIEDAFGLDDDIFGHRARGAEVDVEGSGYGLFLVEKIATAHNGTISYNITDRQYVTFNLFIPD